MVRIHEQYELCVKHIVCEHLLLDTIVSRIYDNLGSLAEFRLPHNNSPLRFFLIQRFSQRRGNLHQIESAHLMQRGYSFSVSFHCTRPFSVVFISWKSVARIGIVLADIAGQLAYLVCCGFRSKEVLDNVTCRRVRTQQLDSLHFNCNIG